MLAVYCRISQEKELGKDRSIDYQREVGVALAKKLNLDYRVYVDEGISGTWDIDKRPSLNKMMDDISSGLITSVFVLEQSRLERNTQVRFIINQIFIDNNIKLYNESGEVDLNDEESTFMGDIMSIMNSFAVKVTKRKVKAVLKKNAREGKAHGILPYGYTTDSENKIAVCPERSKVVKDIFEMSLSGTGYRNIAKELNEIGVPTYYSTKQGSYNNNGTIVNKSDIKWSHGSIRGILKNETYTGKRKFGDEVFDVPVIIPKRLFNRTQENLKNNMTSGSKQFEYDYMLNGLCRCGVCGKSFNGRYVRGKRFMYYQCVTKRNGKDSCGNLSVRKKELEKVLLEVYFKGGRIIELSSLYYYGEDYKKEVKRITDRFKEIEQEIEKNALKKSKVIEAVVEGLLTKADVRSELDKIEQANTDLSNEVERLNDELGTIKQVVKNNITLEKDIKSVDNLEDMARVIGKYIREIVVIKDAEGISVRVSFTAPSFKADFIEMDSNYSSYKVLDDK